MNIVTIGLYREGTTDERFLPGIIRRTFDAVALECASELEVYEPVVVTSEIGTFAGGVADAARQAAKTGLLILCVHADADDSTDRKAHHDRIVPAWEAIVATQLPSCPALVAVVPVHMSEAWILADKALLKEEMGTDNSDHDLGLDRAPEAYADPKQAIEEAIRRAFAHRSRRHRQQVSIGELYLPLGQKVGLDKLAALPSYQKFREGVRDAFRQLNYLH